MGPVAISGAMYAGVPHCGGLRDRVGVGKVGADAGESPVHHQHLAIVAQHHVLWLEIAMDDAVHMGESDSIANTQQNIEVFVERLPDQYVAQGVPLTHFIE